MNLCDEHLCTGCGACAEVCTKNAIRLVQKADGFRRPEIQSGICVGCHICRNACPIQTKPEFVEPIHTFAAFSKDAAERQKSASGGVATMLGKALLQRQGVVFGVWMEDGVHAKYSFAQNEEELLRFQNSKYVESDLGDSYKQVVDFLKYGKEVLFIGLPCQVAAMINIIPKALRDGLYTVDLVCHGTPSTVLLEQYLKNEYGDQAVICSFRNAKSQFFMRVNKGNRSFCFPASADLYYRSFIEGYTYRESCYHCQYAQSKRCSDLTIGDFWGLGKEIPYPYKSEKVSCILENTEKGHRLLAFTSHLLQIDERTLNEAVKQNGQLLHPSEYSYDAKRYRILCESIGPYKAVKKISGIPVRIEKVHWHLACLKRKVLKKLK